MKLPIAICLSLYAGVAVGQSVKCDFQGYKPVAGVTAEQTGDAVVLTWTGELAQQLRAGFTLRDGKPVVTELAVREAAGKWLVLAKELTPEFEVTTGKRRISATQLGLLKQQHNASPDQSISGNGTHSGMLRWSSQESAIRRTYRAKRKRFAEAVCTTSRMPARLRDRRRYE